MFLFGFHIFKFDRKDIAAPLNKQQRAAKEMDPHKPHTMEMDLKINKKRSIQKIEHKKIEFFLLTNNNCIRKNQQMGKVNI